ncbi:haloacid dehalogenase-like hydrolase family protein [Paraburkholderia xenovorans LB400]|uniref:Nonspecific acid phosphatase n=1 Tax=Paraburkholderia xenovorans (strain LB400) TaxID=266265 RepID=Q13SU8_PARXL|nr:HAD family hydrolase [Paraburkholderia xenovorans]ABE32841.1 Nonspecific acid phosphatase precursor [Paraburkholderia xenovorans LB400]AIP30429.1 haloacid dehalogenase-like hydrolase family protein [Paraburkholderia xenovorans LB400]
MIHTLYRYCIAFTVVFLSACSVTPRQDASESQAGASAAATLASWNDTRTKRSIVDFVTLVTTPESRDFIPSADRIAVFDNDGTLWPEQPVRVQLVFALQRVKTVAGRHPEWKRQEPFRSILKGNLRSVAASGDAGSLRVLAAAHVGMTSEQFAALAHEWFDSASDPRFNRLYADLAYQPMLELLAYLRANGFKTYLVTGGDVEFVREVAQRMYGIPPEQVIGSTVRYRYSQTNDAISLTRLAQVDTLVDGAAKPLAIDRVIGRRPVIAFGNADGDAPMLEWTSAGDGPRLAALVHHTDAEREYQYDHASQSGKLDKGLDEAAVKGWLIVDMKDDWKTVFKPANTTAPGATGATGATVK